jgi:glycosyltransferase involved in cell wall biosynthesis
MGLTKSISAAVVIPVFNRGDLITLALESVKAQTHRPLEVIVVDDGSTDNTVETVQVWAAENLDPSFTLRCIEQDNLGANAARNRGIVESKSSLIAFLDSDDRWLPDKVEKQLKELLANKDLGGVYCGLRSMDLERDVIQPVTHRHYPSGDLLARMLIHDVSSPTSCWMVKRECFEETGLFDISLPARQDWDMWIRLSSKYRIGCVPEMLVEMGEHEGDRVRSDPAREIRAHIMIFRKYADLRARFPFWIGLAARSAMYRRRGRVYLHFEESRLRALGMHLLAVGIWPFCFDSYAALLGVFMPANLRSRINFFWNQMFGKTSLGIRSH